MESEARKQHSLQSYTWLLMICLCATRIYNTEAVIITEQHKACSAFEEANECNGDGIEAGDKVRFDVNEKTMFRLMQIGHGGWADGMEKFVGKVGVVKRVDSDGDLIINALGKTLFFNPKSCSKVVPDKFKVGDIVKVTEDASMVKKLQEDYGGWEPSMKKILGKRGKVVNIFEEDQLRIKFPKGKMWTLNPKACIIQPHESDDDDDIDMILNRHKQLVNEYSDIMDISDWENFSEEGDYEIGDKVKIDGDVEKLKLRQKGHGGWNPGMAKAAGKEGVVVNEFSMLGDDDLIVLVGRKKWAINPKSCTKLEDESKDQEDGFELGDQVRIEKDVDKLRKQSFSVGWSDSMENAAGKIGIVVDLDKDGDVKVLIGKKKTAFSPKSCTKI